MKIKLFLLILIANVFVSAACNKSEKTPTGPKDKDRNDYFLSLSPLPDPPEGFEWKLDVRFSDDFNGTELDKTKWRDYHPYWKGRPPAKFMPEAISVKDGSMQIKCGVLFPSNSYSANLLSISLHCSVGTLQLVF